MLYCIHPFLCSMLGEFFHLNEHICAIISKDYYSVQMLAYPILVIYTVKGCGVLNEADVFLELCGFFYDPMDVGNLISGSSAFSKSSLNI